MDPTVLSLHAADTTLAIAPAIGGAVLSWGRGDVAIFREPVAGALEQRAARGFAAYPLVPYSNRIDKGRFRWEGVDYQVPATFGGNAIHGVGWDRAWACRQDGPADATLTLDHPGDAFWPFAFHAELRYALSAEGLSVTIRVQNRHASAAPVGVGLHPFFPRDDDATLTFEAKDVWLNRPDMIPEARVPVPPEWDHTAARPVGGVALDNCFSGWRGAARLVFPTRGHSVVITADALFGHLVVYVPLQFGFFAVEPVSTMNDAINWMGSTPDNGLRVLAPGETLAGAMHFQLERTAA